MNPEELKQNIALFYSKLPPSMQAMFSSMSWLETLKRISSKYNLSEAQIQTLGTETTLVLLGVISFAEYKANLKGEIILPSGESLDEMLAEINSLILNNFREELDSAFNTNNATTPTQQNIDGNLDERFNKLPKNIQDAITKSKYQETLYAISQENKLNIEQTGILEVTTVEVMLGTINPEKFEESLRGRLQISPETIPKLVKDINEKILKKIRENMMAIGNQSQTPTPPPQQAAPVKITIPKPPIPDPASTVHTLKDDMQTLKKAGIDLMPDVKNAPNAHTVAPTPRPTPPPTQPQTPLPVRDASNAVNARGEEMLKQEWHLASGGNTPAKSVEAQKFAGTFQIPKTQTDYAMKNISKTATPTPTINKDQKTSTDPYREVIE